LEPLEPLPAVMHWVHVEMHEGGRSDMSRICTAPQGSAQAGGRVPGTRGRDRGRNGWIMPYPNGWAAPYLTALSNRLIQPPDPTARAGGPSSSCPPSIDQYGGSSHGRGQRRPTGSTVGKPIGATLGQGGGRAPSSSCPPSRAHSGRPARPRTCAPTCPARVSPVRRPRAAPCSFVQLRAASCSFMQLHAASCSGKRRAHRPPRGAGARGRGECTVGTWVGATVGRGGAGARAAGGARTRC